MKKTPTVFHKFFSSIVKNLKIEEFSENVPWG